MATIKNLQITFDNTFTSQDIDFILNAGEKAITEAMSQVRYRNNKTKKQIFEATNVTDLLGGS